jgi:ABC-type multidrug transport system fused ATPase/permease subunit
MSDFKISEPGHETILCTENLTRTMSEVNLVDSVSISIACCQVVAIVGPSGAGKSSFLRLLNRLDEPTRGTVEFRGQDYRQIPPRTLRQKIGMVMQAPNLFPGTVADNMRFGPLQRGEDVTSERLEMLLERVGLHGYASRMHQPVGRRGAAGVSRRAPWPTRPRSCCSTSQPPPWTIRPSRKLKNRSSPASSASRA